MATQPQAIPTIEDLVWEVATEHLRLGPGWAQEAVVLRKVREVVEEQGGTLELSTEQKILDAWHDLFLQKKLAWGYNLDNPGSPFFHIREQ